MVMPESSVERIVRDTTMVFIPGIVPPPPRVIATSNVRRPIKSVSKLLYNSRKSISGSMMIQSHSPFGPAMYASRLMATA